MLTQLLPPSKDKRPLAKTPVTFELLYTLHTYLATLYHGQDLNTPAPFLALRDAIILNLSFFGLLRRSDAAALSPSSIEYSPAHTFALAHITRSKTDQQGDGYTLPVILTNHSYDWSHTLDLYLQLRRPHNILFPTYNSRAKAIIHTSPITPAGLARILPNRIS